jgi:hypothetical protein
MGGIPRKDGGLVRIVLPEKRLYTRHGEERSDEAISLILPGSGRLLRHPAWAEFLVKTAGLRVL